MIRLLLLDVDGVLTDGRIIYDGKGQEWKFFNVKDGHGIKLLQRGGVEVGILSGRESSAVGIRARELKIDLVIQKAWDKVKALKTIQKRRKIALAEVCFVGDDLVDLPVFSRVGFAVAVADSVPEVKKRAHFVTQHPGGHGAVREVCEVILRAQRKWSAVTKKYFRYLD